MTDCPEPDTADWLDKARIARKCNDSGEQWPAWSLDEILGVALLLDDAGMFLAVNVTRQEALERLRYDLALPDTVATARWFVDLRARL